MDGIICQLRRLAIEKRPFACLGCPYENHCSIHGCAVVKQAANLLEEWQKEGNEEN